MPGGNGAGGFGLREGAGGGYFRGMKTSIRLFCILALGVSAAFGAQEARVTGDKVNLRAKPDLSGMGEVVGQVRYGDTLRVRSVGEEWVEVAVPEGIDLWVAKEYVQADGTVSARKLNVRCGPSYQFNVVGVVERGTKLQARDGGAGNAEWLKIAPPEGASVWIYKEYVEVGGEAAEGAEAAAPAEKAPEEKKAAAAKGREGKKAAAAKEKEPKAPKAGKEKATKEGKKAKAEKAPAEAGGSEADSGKAAAPGVGRAAIPTPLVSPSVPERQNGEAGGKGRGGRNAGSGNAVQAAERDGDFPPPAPSDLELVPLAGQGRMTVVEGDVRAAPLLSDPPARYRIVRWQENQWKILGHLYGEAAKYRPYQNKRVRIEGREYWIRNAAAPMLVPTSIELVRE